MFLHKFNYPFYSPDDNEGSVDPINATGILDILNSSDDEGEELDLDDKTPISANRGKKEVSKDTGDEQSGDDSDSEAQKTEPEEKEEDELKDIEEELELDDNEEIDELELVTMPRRKEILGKYPQLFKDFPQLEQAFFRERQYSELLPTISDAKEAVEKVRILNDFENKLLSGDITTVLKAVHDESNERGSQSFNKVVDSYLPALRQVSENAYFHVISSVIKGTIYNMVVQAREAQSQDLEDAAKVLNQFAFGTVKYSAPQKLAQEEQQDPRENEISERERALQERQFVGARDGLNTKMEKVFEKAIQKYIDPKDVMTPYVKKTATKEAHEHLAKVLDGDSRFRTLLDKAWRVAFDRNFDSESMERVEKIIKSRASNVLPAVIRRARQDALRGLGKRVRNTEEEKEESNSGRVSSSSKRPLREASKGAITNNSSKGKLEIPKGMSNRDFILSD